VPAKLSNRVMPYGENYCQLQLLFVLIVTDLPLLQGLFSVDASPALSVGLGADVVHSTLHLVYGFLFQNPARIQINSESRQWPGFVMLS
jgi:hypothetical protein